MTKVKIPEHVKNEIIEMARDFASGKIDYSTDVGGDIARLMTNTYQLGMQHQDEGFPETGIESIIHKIPRRFRSVYSYMCSYLNTVYVPCDNGKAHPYNLENNKLIRDEKSTAYSLKTFEKFISLGLIEERTFKDFDGSILVPSIHGYRLFYAATLSKTHFAGIFTPDNVNELNQNYTPLGESVEPMS